MCKRILVLSSLVLLVGIVLTLLRLPRHARANGDPTIAVVINGSQYVMRRDPVMRRLDKARLQRSTNMGIESNGITFRANGIGPMGADPRWC